MQDHYSVSKSNVLINGRNSNLSTVDQKIILTLASMVQPGEEKFKLYDFKVINFNALCGLKGNPKYSELKKITKNLMKEVIEIDEGDEFLQAHWIESARYIPKKGTIQIRLSDELKPYLIDLHKDFTKYKLRNILKMKSKYSIRLYEILKSQIYKITKYQKKTFIIDIKDLKEKLGANMKSYNSYNNFKVKVLLTAQQELKLLSNVNFDFKEIKTGRKITSLQFFLDENKYETTAAGEEFQQQMAMLDPDPEDETIYKDPVEDEVKKDPVEDEVKRIPGLDEFRASI